MRKLKPQYEDFCRSYAESASAHGAAVAAGYSPKSAYNTGSRLLLRPDIAARVQELRRRIAERESLHAPALLMKLEAAYAHAMAARNPLAMVRVVEMQAKIAGLVGAKRDGVPSDDEIEREIAALAAEPPPKAEARRKTVVVAKPAAERIAEPAPQSAPEPAPEPVSMQVSPLRASDAVLLPVVGHDEVLGPRADDEATVEEERRRQEVRRLALEAVARSRMRKRQYQRQR